MPGAEEAAKAASDSAVPVWYWIVTACGAIVTALGGAKVQQQRTPAPACPLNGRLDAQQELADSMRGLAQRMGEFCVKVDGSHDRHTEMLGKVIEIQQQQTQVLTKLEDRIPR